MNSPRATICPTVLAGNPDEYRQQIERVAGFASRMHIDLADGKFAPSRTIPLESVWWPAGMHIDLHVMYKHPFEHTAKMLRMQPHLIIVHAEAVGDFINFAQQAHDAGIKVGVALKHKTSVEVIVPALDFIDHVLIFSGDIGHFGGKADTHLLTKVLLLKRLKPSLEIGWDGGVNARNAATLAAGGVDVLNVGGYIQHAAEPHEAFETLHTVLHAGPKPRKRRVGG
jgi:ribulose-phosphate 3-epimerase